VRNTAWPLEGDRRSVVWWRMRARQAPAASPRKGWLSPRRTVRYDAGCWGDATFARTRGRGCVVYEALRPPASGRRA